MTPAKLRAIVASPADVAASSFVALPAWDADAVDSLLNDHARMNPVQRAEAESPAMTGVN